MIYKNSEREAATRLREENIEKKQPTKPNVLRSPNEETGRRWRADAA